MTVPSATRLIFSQNEKLNISRAGSPKAATVIPCCATAAAPAISTPQ